MRHAMDDSPVTNDTSNKGFPHERRQHDRALAEALAV